MAGLDDLYNQIPVADIASKLGVDQGEVNQAIQTLVPTLLGSIHENVQADDIDSTELESVVVAEGESDLLTGGVNVDQLDEGQGNQLIASLFGGNNTNQVASALSGAGAQAAPGGGIGDVLGSILGGGGGAAGGGNNALGSILGGVLGGNQGGAIGNILGGLLRGGK
jgi:hypothetical protein